MQITKKQNSDTNATLTIVAEQGDLDTIKKHVLGHFQAKLKLPGFRQGKAPLNIVEKSADQNALQAEFIDEAINHLYQKAITESDIRPVDNPQVSIKKFVPFTELEFEATADVLGTIKIADYKKIKKSQNEAKVTDADVDAVIENLKTRSAERKAVERGAKTNDEVILDFEGKDQKGQAISGADGKDYPLLIGSNTFIPGFEDNVVGLKPGEVKTFTLTFPKDYGVKALADQKVEFTVTVKTVNEITDPKLDDEFAAKVGPFKTIAELKTDIAKQLEVEKQTQVARELENDIIQEIVDNSTLTLPDSLVTEQIERLKNEVRQNLMYRGQTWQEMLETTGKTEEEYEKSELSPEAERRVKTGLVLAEISVAEKLEVSPEELEIRMQILKGQYQDAAMLAELEKPEARREIASRMLTEKTVQRLVEICKK
jgi:trigger factor